METEEFVVNGITYIRETHDDGFVVEYPKGRKPQIQEVSKEELFAKIRESGKIVPFPIKASAVRKAKA